MLASSIEPGSKLEFDMMPRNKLRASQNLRERNSVPVAKTNSKQGKAYEGDQPVN